MRPMFGVLGVAVLLGAINATPAAATPITINFSVKGSASDPLYGANTASGYFTFDQDIIAPNVLYQASGPTDGLNVIDAAFSWGDGSYTETDLKLSYLYRSFSGSQFLWTIGAAPSGYGGVSSNQSPDFYLSLTSFTNPSSSYFVYSTPGNHQYIVTGGITSVSYGPPPSPVPEPASLAMLGTGLATVIVRRRRRRS
jgi:hypothetical protein